MLPLVSTLALHPSQPLKSWAQHVLSMLQPPLLSSKPNSHIQTQHAKPSMAFHGLPVLLQQAAQQLEAMSRWSSQQGQQEEQQMDGKPDDSLQHSDLMSPMSWLTQLTAALQQIRTAGTESANDWESSQQDEVTKLVLVALLDHPELCVQAAAANTCGEAVQAFPLSGISFLPLLMYKLRRSLAEATKGSTYVHLCLCAVAPLLCYAQLVHTLEQATTQAA